MLVPVSKLETLSLSLETHVGLGFWARLERADGMASGLASVPSLEQRK